MSDYFDRIERQLVGAVEARPQRTRPRTRPVVGSLVAAAVAIAVVVIATTVGRPSGQPSPTAGSEPTAIVLRPSVDASFPGISRALKADVSTLRRRLETSFPAVKVTRLGDMVVLSNVRRAQQPNVLQLTVPGRLRFFDWEADVLLPGKHTVASLLRRQNATALVISQGAGSAVPGTPRAGGLPLLEAVKLADHDQSLVRNAVGQATDIQAFLFRKQCRPSPRQSCLVAGPAASRAALLASLPTRTKPADTRTYTVPSGILVVQASTSAGGGPISFADPSARYFVLLDVPALTGGSITRPQASTDQSGNPDVTFGFSGSGQSAFQRVTRAIAHRGGVVSGSGETLNQHFAVTIDGRVLTVPSIDFKTYPDGIGGGGGADISGVTRTNARELATLLRAGPLPVPLMPAS